MARKFTSRMLSAISSTTVATSTAWSAPADTINAAIHVHSSGNLVCTFVGDTNPTTMPVVQGVMYPYSIKSLAATNAVQVTILYN